MSSHYKAIVNQEHEFDFEQDHLTSLDAISVSKDSYHILDNKQSYTAEVTDADFSRKKYRVVVNNNTYEVVIADEVDILIDKMGLTVGASKHQNELISPMPGLIIDVQVSAGQQVKEGDTLVILSAMKMENSFVSHTDGVIKSVHVAKDDTVDKGELLVEFEPVSDE